MAKSTTRYSYDDRRARGKAARADAPRSGQSSWLAFDGRADPVSLLEEQNRTREPDLVPVRHGRMAVSPFTFYRGAARIMAADLARTATAGLDVQLCGDAHLSNFGAYASPERQLVFDLNDFDETLAGPFEYDVKRMATSFVIAGRNNGFTDSDATAVGAASVTAYRDGIAEFADMGTMQLWYTHMTEDELRTAIKTDTGDVAAARAGGDDGGKRTKKRERWEGELAQRAADRNLAKAHTRDSLQALSKLAEVKDGEYRLVSAPLVVVPVRELAGRYGMDADEAQRRLDKQFREYRATLRQDRRQLLQRFRLLDFARKVVGVGSVGTRAYIALLQGDGGDPLFLQMKEATRSVLEEHLPRSRFRNHGARVVHGQRMMQATSDIFLGWTTGPDGRSYYWRQLRDMKTSANVETMNPLWLTVYARLCGRTLARAHARSGDPVVLAGYLGTGSRFDRAVADFAVTYADQNERDYARFAEAIRTGRIEAEIGV